MATAGTGSFPITYTFTDEHGCTNAAASSITVNPKPTPSITGVDATYCLSNTIVTPTLTPTGGTLSGPGVSGNTISIFNAGAGTHTVKYIVTNQFGCTDSTQVSFTVTSTIPPVFTIQDEICLNAAPISLSGIPAGGTFTTGGQTITQFDPAAHGVGTHAVTYTITDLVNPQCLAQTTDTIEVINGAVITTNTPTYFCFNSSDYQVVMQPAGGTLAGDLHLNGNTLEVSLAPPGNYSFTYDYTSPQGCSGTYVHNFTIGSELSVEYTASVDCFQGVTLVANPSSYANYTWYEDTINLGGGNPLTTTAELAGNHMYTVEATDVHGCKAFYSNSVVVPPGITAEDFNIPNVITPNGDGVNDYIEMPFMDFDCINYTIEIVNRWGHLVFEASKTNPIFSGTDKRGVELSGGVYFYRIISDDFNCKEEPYKSKCQGFISINR